jgi:DNA-directed RNA polymerase subunit H (RpoH/RPB5)
MSINIELNYKEINILLCTNILKMLERRKLINNWEKIFNEIKDDINNKSSFDFLIDNKTKYSIYIVSAKLTSIIQGTPIDEYLSSNIDTHKIIVIKDCTKKVVKQIVNEYKNAEFFFEHEMIEDIPIKDFIPEHQVLSEEEKKELLTKFNENHFSIIFNTDMMSRYYKVEVNDIFRIIRMSLTSGKNISYRRVQQGNWDILFP